MENLLRETIINYEKESFIQVYNRLPIVVDRAEGVWIWDKNGNKYLDLLGGIAVNVLGHSHPKITQAIIEQAQKYLHLSNYFYQDAQINFVKKLTQLTGYKRAFLTNSGTESADGAIKLIRKWGTIHNKSNIIAFSGGFHGRTYGALSIMDKPNYKLGMGPFLPNCRILPYNSVEDLVANIDLNTAAVFLEFIQGEGGISSVRQEFVDTLFELKQHNNFLIVADEVQSGMGRTGKFFSFEHWGVRPDVVIVSKGLGGGLPLGAILIDEHLADVWEKAQHGTTFGGNALSCAAGLVSLEEIESELMDNAAKVGNYFISELEKVQIKFPNKIKEIRGKGLMLGIVLSFEAKILLDELLKRNVIANATSVNVLRIVPPLILAKEHVDVFISELIDSLNGM